MGYIIQGMPPLGVQVQVKLTNGTIIVAARVEKNGISYWEYNGLLKVEELDQWAPIGPFVG